MVWLGKPLITGARFTCTVLVGDGSGVLVAVARRVDVRVAVKSGVDVRVAVCGKVGVRVAV